MNKNLTITAVLGITTIILGAFGAHALSKSLTIEGLNSFETAVLYQMFHVIVLLFVNTYKDFTIQQQNRISYLFFLGILFFSNFYQLFIVDFFSQNLLP